MRRLITLLVCLCVTLGAAVEAHADDPPLAPSAPPAPYAPPAPAAEATPAPASEATPPLAPEAQPLPPSAPPLPPSARPSSAPPQYTYAQPGSQIDPRPRSGWGGIIVGAAGLAFAAEQLLTIPVCYADWYPLAGGGVCAGTAVVLGAGGLVAGITGLVIGTRRHHLYKEWRERELQRRGVVLDGFSGGYYAGQGTLRLQLRF
jgi:hypothetical protein